MQLYSKSSGRALAFLALPLLFTACYSEAGDHIGSNLPDLTFEEFAATVFQEPDTGVYIVNGDTPMENLELLREFYEQVFVRGELIVNTVNGADDIWNTTERYNLTYCVSQSTFGSNYDRVVQAMDQAAGAWEQVADIDFVHVASQDGNCTARNGNVMFDVNQTTTTQYLARAFFPSTSRRNRNVLVSVTVYPYDDDNSDPLSLVGVLRHELGHTLGFRHEHTRPESGVCFEDSNWRPLTTYDSGSVMHYPQCNGSGDWSLTLTSRDAQGAGALYPSGGGDGGGGPTCDLGQVGDSCSANSDCCSNSCKGGPGKKTCR